MSDLLALADRCEKASGPNRELDAEIEVAVVGFPEWAYHRKNGIRPKGSPELDRMSWLKSWGVLRYTASLDAAMSLVPDGWDWCLAVPTNEPCSVSIAPEMSVAEHHGEACTPALALCAAALRARATQ